jgi:glyoxylase-like metal-dependent hydrolase (beta-lactamase superfamily II)
MLWQDLKEPAPDTVRLFYRRLGWSETRIETYLERRYGWYSRAVEPIPRSLCRLQNDGRFSVGQYYWRVIVGRGHSPEHACLYCENLNILIAGDQVLPKISPHIGVYPGEPDANPLADYLTSLETLRSLPQDTLVLPSHGDPFYGLHVRRNALREHHAVRLERLYDACTEATVAADLIPAMFSRELREEDMSLATSEGLAHMHYLIEAGRMKREMAADGRYRFRRTEHAEAA